MRLDWLRVVDFKNLRDFEVDFDKNSMTTVLVGQNGSGKSNLIEALVVIFRDLDLAETPSFPYLLRYICRDHVVEIDADPQRTTKKISISVDQKPVPYREFAIQDDREFLPANVFGYYSGPSNRLESHFEKHQERFYEALLKGEDRAPRPLFYARQIHSQFVLLAFFSHKDQQAKDFLKDRLGILGLESVLFVMRQPPWKSKIGDSRFWNARGVVRDFLGKLYDTALAPLRLRQRVSLGLRKWSTLEHLYLYLKDLQALTDLAAEYAHQRDFFKTLESTYISELIAEVRIRVKVRNVDGSLTFRELAEGEQQLLTVLGLLRFTREEDSLFLLDEPDTHLNPVWSVEYLEYLKDLVGREETSHIIMATHDPLVFAGLEKSQVQIMKRDSESGRVYAQTPDTDPKGMGIGAILTSEMFGLRSTLDLPTLELLDRKRKLASKEGKLSDDEQSELDELTKRLGTIDFSTTVRDPLYPQFVLAMTKIQEAEGLTEPVLSDSQRTRQRELALDVLSKLKEAQDR
jgi:predicted ATPase